MNKIILGALSFLVGTSFSVQATDQLNDEMKTYIPVWHKSGTSVLTTTQPSDTEIKNYELLVPEVQKTKKDTIFYINPSNKDPFSLDGYIILPHAALTKLLQDEKSKQESNTLKVDDVVKTVTETLEKKESET